MAHLMLAVTYEPDEHKPLAEDQQAAVLAEILCSFPVVKKVGVYNGFTVSYGEKIYEATP